MEKRKYNTPDFEMIRYTFPKDVLAGSIMPTNTAESGISSGDEGMDDGF